MQVIYTNEALKKDKRTSYSPLNFDNSSLQEVQTNERDVCMSSENEGLGAAAGPKSKVVGGLARKKLPAIYVQFTSTVQAKLQGAPAVNPNKRKYSADEAKEAFGDQEAHAKGIVYKTATGVSDQTPVATFNLGLLLMAFDRGEIQNLLHSVGLDAEFPSKSKARRLLNVLAMMIAKEELSSLQGAGE